MAVLLVHDRNLLTHAAAQISGLVTHEAETGGGPTGFGWASFLVLLLGVGVIAYSLGSYLVARAAAQRSSNLMEPSALHDSFDPYDDLTRD